MTDRDPPCGGVSFVSFGLRVFLLVFECLEFRKENFVPKLKVVVCLDIGSIAVGRRPSKREREESRLLKLCLKYMRC